MQWLACHTLRGFSIPIYLSLPNVMAPVGDSNVHSGLLRGRFIVTVGVATYSTK